jgi:hypothetical protein
VRARIHRPPAETFMIMKTRQGDVETAVPPFV